MKKSTRIFLIILAFILLIASAFGAMTYLTIGFMQGSFMIENTNKDFENSSYFENTYLNILYQTLSQIEYAIDQESYYEQNDRLFEDLPIQLSIMTNSYGSIVDSINEDIINDNSLIVSYDFTSDTLYTNMDNEDFYASIFSNQPYSNISDQLREELIYMQTVVDPYDQENFPYIYNLRENYSMAMSNFNSSYLTLLLIPLFFLSIYLIYKAGRDEEGNLSLNSFDKIPIEIILVFALIMLFASFFIIEIFIALASDFEPYNYGYRTYSIFASYNEIKVAYILLSSGLGLVYLGFLSIALSISRRIKAKILLKNSIIYRLFKTLITIFKNIFYSFKETPKIIVSFAAVIFLNILAVFLIFGSPSSFSIFAFIGIIVFDIYLLQLLIKYKKEQNIIVNTASEIARGNQIAKINTEGFYHDNVTLSNSINNMYDGIQNAVDKSMKSERMKTDLITNVSHDIKTPLTSIINYSDLLMKENFEDSKINEYVEIINRKSKQLKTMTEDIVDASKASSGAIEIVNEIIDLDELMKQLSGEYEEKFSTKNLDLIYTNTSENNLVLSDGKYLYRVLANLFDNAYKYSLENTRVYLTLYNHNNHSIIEVKNLSKNQLNISSDELYQRFVRGDKSRTSPGSGLGISIAKDLMKLLNGNLEIIIDGDYFKAQVILRTYIDKI